MRMPAMAIPGMSAQVDETAAGSPILICMSVDWTDA
jgi:hypothetical protein